MTTTFFLSVLGGADNEMALDLGGLSDFVTSNSRKHFRK